MKSRSADALGMLGRKEQPALRAQGQGDEHHLVGLGRVHHRERVRGELCAPRIRWAGSPSDPLPRPSKVTTRQCLARYGICIFQWREWMTDHVGRTTPWPSPEP